jgi:hypothetical protein
MGSLFQTKVPTPPPPPPPSSYIDQVSGVEEVPQTNADGSITYVTRPIPLTPEQQAQKDQLTQIMNDSLTAIQGLSASDYANDPATQAVLDQWRQAQQKVLDRQYASRTQQEEQNLAARGIADSSTANDVRRQRRLDQQDAELNLQNQTDELGSEVRNQNLQLQQQLYSLAAGSIDASQAAAEQAAIKNLSTTLSNDTARQASLLNYYNQALPSSNSVFGNALARSAGSALGGGVGSIFGPAGTTTGSLLGSWLWK